MPLLPARFEYFAHQIVKGKNAKQAYAEIYPEASDSSCESAGPRLFRAVQVQERVQFLLGKAAERVTMTLGEALAFLEMAVRTPIKEIDENSPLAHKKTVTVTATGAERTTVEGISKKDALDMLAKMSGWYKSDAPNEAGYEPTEDVAKRVEGVALDLYQRRGDVERVLRAFKKA